MAFCNPVSSTKRVFQWIVSCSSCVLHSVCTSSWFVDNVSYASTDDFSESFPSSSFIQENESIDTSNNDACMWSPIGRVHSFSTYEWVRSQSNRMWHVRFALSISFVSSRCHLVRERKSILDRMDSTNNYDMTILHDDQLDNTDMTQSHRQLKKIPHWARSKFTSSFCPVWIIVHLFIDSQLQLAYINQIYFQERNPEDIFGPVHLDRAREMLESIALPDVEHFYGYPSFLPSNFV
jgi:hypothetical protein